MNLLCLVRLHRWRVSRIQSYRYGAVVTEVCRRPACPAIRKAAR